MKSHERGVSIKTCNGCQQVKPATAFYASSRSAKCKACLLEQSKQLYDRKRDVRLKQCAEYREKNAEKVSAYHRGLYLKNKDTILERHKAYQAQPHRKQADTERHRVRWIAKRDELLPQRAVIRATAAVKAQLREYFQKHYAENKDYYSEKNAKRRAHRVRATPKWYRLGDAHKFYVEARRLTLETGVKHVVDHIIPLQGKTVCGLHVKENLQVIPEAENLTKANKFYG